MCRTVPPSRSTGAVKDERISEVSGCEFSDSEVEQIALVAHEQFGQDGRWVVNSVARRSALRDVVHLQIENEQDDRRVTIPLTCQEFSEPNPANGSQLTDTVFNISIRLMEFTDIRGFDEFEDGATVPLEIYPEGRAQPDKLPSGVERHLMSPFRHDLDT
jgi:hypothetical protein